MSSPKKLHVLAPFMDSCVRAHSPAYPSVSRRDWLRPFRHVHRWSPVPAVFVLAALLFYGCTTTTPDVKAPAAGEEGAATVVATREFPLAREQLWDVVKGVLRRSEGEVYTRDKEGIFVVYIDRGRHLLTPHRFKVTITLLASGENKTAVKVELVPEAYTVTLLTEPAWRPRGADERAGPLAMRLLEDIEQSL